MGKKIRRDGRTREAMRIDLIPELKYQFQVYCVKNQRSMAEVVEEIIADFLEEQDD